MCDATLGSQVQKVLSRSRSLLTSARSPVCFTLRHAGGNVGGVASPLPDLVFDGLLVLVEVGCLARHLHNALGGLPHGR